MRLRLFIPCVKGAGDCSSLITKELEIGQSGVLGAWDCSSLVYRELEIVHPWSPGGWRLFNLGVLGAGDCSFLKSRGLLTPALLTPAPIGITVGQLYSNHKTTVGGYKESCWKVILKLPVQNEHAQQLSLSPHTVSLTVGQQLFLWGQLPM